jgi:hypothetical protein
MGQRKRPEFRGQENKSSGKSEAKSEFRVQENQKAKALFNDHWSLKISKFG